MSIPSVVRQHADDAISLSLIRRVLTNAPHVTIGVLSRLDDRLAANLDGLLLAGDCAWLPCDEMLVAPSAGSVFTVAIRAIEEKQQSRFDRLVALAQAVPETCVGLISAFGWLQRVQLQGIVAVLLGSQDPFRRMIGVAACAMHRVDPGLVSAHRILDTSPLVRARALRTAGEIGCQDAVPACEEATREDDPEGRVWAARSAVFLGNRGTALEVLTNTGLAAGPHRLKAFRLALQAMMGGAAHGVLQQLAEDPGQRSWLIQGSGIAGDPKYVPWLIGHMVNEKTARLAGEAFSLITGVDLGQNDLEGNKPENFESGPNDDPNDPNVDMDQNDGLPWPDPDRIQNWWAANGSRFQTGQRYFMGARVSREHCIDVLKHGYQRQRILAAHYLCLLEPGTPLFNTSAPAWRQQRLLAKMT